MTLIFKKVFNDPHIILKVLKSNIEGIANTKSDPQLFVNAIQEEMINIRNALIISDVKLLEEKQNPRLKTQQ
jgi:hypothetical protein